MYTLMSKAKLLYIQYIRTQTYKNHTYTNTYKHYISKNELKVVL